ncbi:MAG: hypothetical protein Q9M30_09740, partial [Mariprofundaceae bacterium]|nr:hypothetical protein [Mariprofundaceae bacterium]
MRYIHKGMALFTGLMFTGLVMAQPAWAGDDEDKNKHHRDGVQVIAGLQGPAGSQGPIGLTGPQGPAGAKGT